MNIRIVMKRSQQQEDIRQEINEIRTESGSGGRLNLYRAFKDTPWTERYVVNVRTVGGRRVMIGLRMECSSSSGNWIPTFHTRKGSVGCALEGDGGPGSFYSHLPML